MTVIIETISSDVDISRRQKSVADLGGATMYFAIERTQEDLLIEQALNDLAWAELAACACE